MTTTITPVWLKTNLLEPNDFSTSHYDYNSRYRKPFCKGKPIEKPCDVTPRGDKFKVVVGLRRYFKNLREGVLETLCNVIDIKDEDIPAAVLLSNEVRVKTIYEQCIEAYPHIPPSQQGKEMGRYKIAIEKANVEISVSTLKRFCVVKELDKRYPDLKLEEDVKKGVPISTVLSKAMQKKEYLKRQAEKLGKALYEVNKLITNPYYLFNDDNKNLRKHLNSIKGYTGIDLTFTSPYYMNQRTYSKKKEAGHEGNWKQYSTGLKPTFQEIYKETKCSGICAVNLGDTYGRYDNNQILHRFSLMMTDEIGWHFFFKQIWHKLNVLTKGNEDKVPVYNYEEILFFCKDPDKCKFKPIDIYSEEKIVEFVKVGGRKNADGTNTKEKWALSKPYTRFKQFITHQEFKVIHTAAAGADSRLLKQYGEDGHEAVMPLEVPLYAILACTEPSDFLFDAYAGAGTTMAIGRLLGRTVAGMESKSEYAQLIDKRLTDLATDAAKAAEVESMFKRKFLAA